MGYGQVMEATGVLGASAFASGLGWIIAGAAVATVGVALALRFYFRRGKGVK